MKTNSKHRVKNAHRTIWSTIKRISIPDNGHLLFSAFVIALLAIIVINTVYILNRQNDIDANTNTVTNLVSKPQKILTSQQIATSPTYTISISKVSENATFDPAFTIADNETMLICTLTITNTSKGTHDFVPDQQLYVRSSDGDYAQLHASMFVTNPIASKTLKPGETITGQVSFNVPKTQARPLLYVDLGWNNYGPVVFDVLH